MENNADNLKPYQFKPGKSGNPNGRPKGAKSLTTQLKKMLEAKIKNYDPIKDEDVTQSIADHLINVLLSKALNGEDKAIMEILNRSDGPVKQEIDQNISGGLKILEIPERKNVDE